MVKSIVVARKRAGMSRGEYNKYWEQTHGPLVARLIPGLRRYVQNHLIDIPGMDYLRSERGRLLMEDGNKFADMTDAKVWIVEEHVIL
jgi:hypothetical protein